MSPNESALKVVTNFLASFGVEGDNIKVSKFGDKVSVKMSATVASTMLDTEFGRFRSLQMRSLALLRITKFDIC